MNSKDMQKFIKRLEEMNIAAWLLRIGLAFAFLYASVSQMQHPLLWTGYVPSSLTTHIDVMTILKLTELYEFVLAIWLLSGIYLRAAGLIAALTLMGIIVTNAGQFIVTFRDVGLACAALALAFMPRRKT